MGILKVLYFRLLGYYLLWSIFQYHQALLNNSIIFCLNEVVLFITLFCYFINLLIPFKTLCYPFYFTFYWIHWRTYRRAYLINCRVLLIYFILLNRDIQTVFLWAFTCKIIFFNNYIIVFRFILIANWFIKFFWLI